MESECEARSGRGTAAVADRMAVVAVRMVSVVLMDLILAL